MSGRHALIAALFSWPLAACVTSPAAVASAEGAPSAYELVDARRGGMAMSVSALAAVSAGAASDRPLASLGLPANGLASFARAVPGLFGEATRTLPGTRARPEIWTDREGFVTRATEFQAATGALAAAARADDRPAFEAALASTKAACKACHDSYRVEP